MKIKFREVRLKSNKERLKHINTIVAEYQKEGYKLTLRQLYYQLVSRDVIPNKQSEYSKLSTLLKEGRMGGIVDWSAIEDRLRQPSVPSSWETPQSIMESAIDSYALPRMKGQKNYIEVWVEKDALSGVLKRVTEKYHIPILVNRGYSSASAMYDAWNRFRGGLRAIDDEYSEEGNVIVFYLGDFDPSGMDMIRDVRDRVNEFANGKGYDGDFPLEVIPVALTKTQIKKYNPPPNPAKPEKFIAEHGATSWEVDALPPNILNKLLEAAIKEKLDSNMYDEVVSREDADKERLRELMEQL